MWKVHSRRDFDFFGAMINYFTQVDSRWYIKIENVLNELGNSSVQGYYKELIKHACYTLINADVD